MYTKGYTGQRYYGMDERNGNGFKFNGGRYQKKRFYKRGGNNMAYQNKRAISKINKTLKDIEYKFIDTDVNEATLATTGHVSLGFTIAQGDGQSQREGRKVRIKSIAWRGRINLVTSSVLAEGTDIVRLMAIHDKQANKALPSIVDFLELSGIESFKNLENSGRFRTIWDKTFEINCNGIGGDGTTVDTAPAEIFFEYYKDIDIEIIYDDVASTGVVGTINSHNIVIMVLSEFANAGITSTLRARYTDL